MADTTTQDVAAAPEDARKVSLVSLDGDSFEVSRSVAAMSELVKTLISGACSQQQEGLGWTFELTDQWLLLRIWRIADEQDDDEVQEIPLPNVKSTVLSKVIEFCNQHHNNPMAEIEKVRWRPIGGGCAMDIDARCLLCCWFYSRSRAPICTMWSRTGTPTSWTLSRTSCLS